MWSHVTSLGSLGQVGSLVKQLLGMFILFNTVTMRDEIDVQKAHKAFLEIEEYRRAIAPDAPGAEA